MNFKKNIFHLMAAFTLAFSGPIAKAAEDYGSANPADSLIDDSVRDFSIVMGSGLVGAVLGLSTLSFVDTPSEHLKNIAVGGAVGIVVGVGVVVFGQVSRSAATNGLGLREIPMNPEKFANLTRKEFSEYKIAKNFLKEPSFGYNFSF